MNLAAQLVETCIMIATIAALVGVCAATVYDTISMLQSRRLNAALHRLRYHRLPQVTYIIPIRTSADSLEECLGRIQNGYRRYDCVVVVESGAPAAVKQMTRQVVGWSQCRLYICRKPASRRKMLAAAYRRSQRGEYIVLVRPDQLLDPTTTRRALAWCSVLPRCGGIRFASLYQPPVTVATIASHLIQVSGQLGAKAAPFHWSSVLSPGLYRQSAFRQCCRGKRIITQYRADATIESTRRPRPNSLLLFAGLIMWMTVLYSCIAAAMLLSAWPLVTSWGITCVWLVAAIWFDTSLSLLRKIDLTICLPFGYFALFGNGMVAVIRRFRGRATI